VGSAGSFGKATRRYQTGALAWHYYRELVALPAGLTVVAVALYAFILIPNLAEGPVDVPGLPTTARVTALLNYSALRIVVMTLITLLAGQLVWRERDTRLNEIFDAVPVPDRVLLAGKYLGLALFLFTLQTALLAAGVAVQLRAGHSPLNAGLYLGVLYEDQLPDYCLFAAVAMALHVAVNGKYVGHLVGLLFLLYTCLAGRFGIEHKLLIFGSDPGLAPSVFYGSVLSCCPGCCSSSTGPGWALLGGVVAGGLLVRGSETGWRERLQRAGRGLRRSHPLAAALLLVLGTGAAIFYNTNVLNAYRTVAGSREGQVQYERRYRKYAGTPQPHLTATMLHVEFYPDQRAALVRGTYQLKNGTGRPIDSLHLAVAPELETSHIRFSRPARRVLSDRERGHLIYAFGSPLRPGDSVTLRYQVRFAPRGFSNQGLALPMLDNGSYFRNAEWLPAVGYQAGRELGNDPLRRTYGLPPRPELSALDNALARADRAGREMIRFAATVGTAAGQTAIAPGSLRKKWREGDRQYFHYVADKPIRNLYHVYSAAYAVRTSRWQGIHTRIFHHPQSVLNLDRIESAMRASLAHYERHLGPYPYRQLSFVEYPDPGTGGISLPGTVGYSTNFAMLNPGADPRGFDLVFAVAAHEVAHQWWGHQLAPAPVEGAPLLSESLAWYSALGVVEEAHGSAHLQNLLDAMRQEYLTPRSRAGVPLLRATDGFQGYRKGPLALYALRQYVGAERVNGALRNLLHEFRSGEPPFATALDLDAHLRAVTPDSLHYLLTDLFGTNTFWELRTKAARVQPAGDGHFLVTLDVLARKVQGGRGGSGNGSTHA
jgi:aminopeptidase N